MCSVHPPSIKAQVSDNVPPQDTMSETIHQPIHPSVLSRLDPEYVAFHNKHTAFVVPPHTIPWHPDIRKLPVVPGASPVVQVGSVRDIALQHCKIRVYTPEGDPPDQGHPVFLYIHGGQFPPRSLFLFGSRARLIGVVSCRPDLNLKVVGPSVVWIRRHRSPLVNARVRRRNAVPCQFRRSVQRHENRTSLPHHMSRLPARS